MINHLISARVLGADFATAYDFYVNKLGFEERHSQQLADGGFWLEVAPDNAQTSLLITSLAGNLAGISSRYTQLIWHTDNIYKTHEYLKNRGVVFIQPPTRQPGGGLLALFQDDDGNIFELVES